MFVEGVMGWVKVYLFYFYLFFLISLFFFVCMMRGADRQPQGGTADSLVSVSDPFKGFSKSVFRIVEFVRHVRVHLPASLLKKTQHIFLYLRYSFIPSNKKEKNNNSNKIINPSG